MTKRNTLLDSAHRGLSDGMPIYMVSIVSHMCQWYQKCQWYHTCITRPIGNWHLLFTELDVLQKY
jgi:hypothetical protein